MIHGSKREPSTPVISTRVLARRSKVDVDVYSPSSIDVDQSTPSVLPKKTSNTQRTRKKRRELPGEQWTCRLHVALGSPTHDFHHDLHRALKWLLKGAGGSNSSPGSNIPAHPVNGDSAQGRPRRENEASWKPQHGVDDNNMFKRESVPPTGSKCLPKPAGKSLGHGNRRADTTYGFWAPAAFSSREAWTEGRCG